MAIATRLIILDPVQAPSVEGAKLAPRLDTLNGKVVGLFNNSKLNAKELLDMVGGVLSERFNLKGIVRGTFSTSDKVRREEWKDLDRCDLVVLANGD